MITVFHGTDAQTHDAFQRWRQANVDGFHMTEKSQGRFVIHYAQDKRENEQGRGCEHQGCSYNGYHEDNASCYTTARKVCSTCLAELIQWARERGYQTRNCKHCDTRRFPFPSVDPELATQNECAPPLREGAVRRVTVNDYERNPEARRICLRAYGTVCIICGFDFGAVYGEVARGFIHVHHVRALSDIGAEYEVDPEKDLRPVCPNCHAVTHLDGQCRSIEEMKHLLRVQRR